MYVYEQVFGWRKAQFILVEPILRAIALRRSCNRQVCYTNSCWKEHCWWDRGSHELYIYANTLDMSVFIFFMLLLKPSLSHHTGTRTSHRSSKDVICHRMWTSQLLTRMGFWWMYRLGVRFNTRFFGLITPLTLQLKSLGRFAKFKTRKYGPHVDYLHHADIIRLFTS